MKGIALLGAGRMAQVHAAAINAAGARVAAIYDPVASAVEALAARTGAQTAKTAAEAMQAVDVDAIVIATSSDTHVELIVEAVKTGKPVLCEKPLAPSLAEARRCIEQIGEEAAKRVFLGFNRRYDRGHASVREAVKAGKIGRLEQLTITSRDPYPPPLEYIPRSGGLFRDMMIHDFDMARFLLGEEPVEVSALASCLVDPEIGKAGDIDTAVVTLRTASGKLAQISNSRRATYGYDQRIEVHGSGGLLRAHNLHATTVERANAQGFNSDPVLHFFLERYLPAYRAEMDAFITGVTAGKPLNPSGEDGLKALLLADAAEASMKSGKTVRVA